MTIQYSLVISIEKIISLYIQKYRFEQYENNQDKYHGKLVLQRKVGGRGQCEALPAVGQINRSECHGSCCLKCTGATWESGEAHPPGSVRQAGAELRTARVNVS